MSVDPAICPWHGDNTELDLEDNGAGTFWVICNKNGCGCEGPYGHSPEEAWEKWNRRAATSPAGDLVSGDDELYAWLYPYVCDDGQTRILIGEMRQRFSAAQALRYQSTGVTGEVDKAKAEAIDLLLNADDIWEDYGSGFRIHFSFAPNSDDRVVERVHTAKSLTAALSAQERG